jgi:hypothetical protein
MTPVSSEANERGPSISLKRVPTKRYRSASMLAEALGFPVVEPGWWPEDAGKITYRRLDHRPLGTGYSMLAIRRGGVPVGVVAHPEHPAAGLADGEWRAAPELQGLRGMIGKVGRPPRLHAVAHAEGMRIHLIGYQSETEIVRAASSLQRPIAE